MRRATAAVPGHPWDAIRREFGYSAQRDQRVASLVQGILARPPYDSGNVIEGARSVLQGRSALVVGAADTAADGVRRAPMDWPIVAADGATTAVAEADRLPSLIVTDLDGQVEDQVRAAGRGSLVFVHAHGDNEERLRRWLPRFPPASVAGTCQVDPVTPLINPGGFTDGDRACYLAHELGASSLRLVGFDFEGPVGRYSGAYDQATKRAKLRWCQKLLEALAEKGCRIEYAQ